MSSANKRISGGTGTNETVIKKSKSSEGAPEPITDVEQIQINAVTVGYALEHFVNKLSRQVEEDWHDGYEDQSVTKMEWFMQIQQPLQAVLNVGVKKKAALRQCNAVLNTIAGSFNDLCEVPCRCDTKSELWEMDKSFDLTLPWGGELTATSAHVVDAWSYVWVALLRVHSSLEDVDHDLLLECIHDASDNMEGAEIMEFPGTLYKESASDYDTTFGNEEDKNAPGGEKLAQIVKEKAPQCVWVEGKRVELRKRSPQPPPPPISADEKVLLDAGWSRQEYKEHIVPLGNTSPWKERDPDTDHLAFCDVYDEPMDSSKFLWVEYGGDFEYLDDEGNQYYVPMFDIEKLHRYKKLTKNTSALIGKILFNNRMLQYLDINNLDRVGEDIAHALFQHWHGKNCQLECLNMDSTGLGGERFHQFIQRLLHHNTKLVELKLTNTKLTNENAGELARVLSSGPSTLRHLSFMNNGLSDKGAKLISEAIYNMPNLETVDLMGNNITKYESISKMLQSPKLRKINLRFCFGTGHCGKVSPAESSKLMGEFMKSLQRYSNQWKFTGWGDMLERK